ncbi:TIGR03643 family protein [Psychrobacter sp. ANT_H56B]|nr:TIGR03643 family protein [Psychrobacter sp. ANT_H56B]
MASYQDLSTVTVDTPSVEDNSVATKATLATMQADMDAALKNKQRDLTSTNLNNPQNHAVKSSPVIAASINDMTVHALDELQVSRVIEMAWEDRTPFEAIEHSYGLNESGVITLMRQVLKPSSFRLWRQRVSNRATKHEAMRGFTVGRAYCKTQYKPR